MYEYLDVDGTRLTREQYVALCEAEVLPLLPIDVGWWRRLFWSRHQQVAWANEQAVARFVV